MPLQYAWSAPSEDGAASAYEDRLLQPDALWADPDAEIEPYDASGPTRSMRLEAVRTLLDSNGERLRENGLLFGFMRETESHGAFSLEGSLPEGGNGVFTAWQRNVAFDGGWHANNGLGVLYTPSIDLARRQYRFFIPTLSMMGGSTEWINDSGATFSAGLGQPGLYTGIRVPAFHQVPGTVYSIGGQIPLPAGWEVGVQAAGANGTNLNPNPFRNTKGPELSTNGALASAAWTGTDARVQANLIGVDSNIAGFHGGGWVDGWLKGSVVDHHAGIFHMEPGLLWGNQQIVTDLQGAYYRATYQDRQWQWDGGMDYATPVSGDYGSSTFYTANGRYQYSRDWGFGAGANVRRGLSDAWSAFAYVDNQNAWGATRTEVNHAQDSTRHGTQLTLDHTWRTGEAYRLSTAASFLREDTDFGSTNNVGLSVYGGGNLGNNITLDGNVQWNAQSGLAEGSSTYVNAALDWRFMPNWAFNAFAYQNNANVWRPLVVSSPIVNPELVETESLKDRGLFLSLRYEFSAGRSHAPLGGRPGEGAGRVSGMIYLDHNDDTRLSPGEPGVANLTVLLDGKFVTRTDAAGRFEFSQVKAGPHVVTVQPDNLPLPWRMRGEGRQEFAVGVRENTLLEIGAFRMR